VPASAERHVDPKLVSLANELVTELGPHAKQHLELIRVPSQATPLDESERLADQPVVMGGDADVGADVEKSLESVEEVEPNRLVFLVGDFRRLDVDPLADTDVGAQVAQRGDVVEGPLERRLEHD